MSSADRNGEVGADAHSPIPRTLRELTAGIAADREIGVQLHVSQSGAPVADLALGEADRGVPMRPDTLNLWISMSKPVMGVAFGQLVERGLLDWEDRIADHLPEFAAGGKEPIRIRDVLTHTAGFRGSQPEWLDRRPFWEVVRSICEAPQEDEWDPGVTSGYNVAAAWYVLAAVLEKADGRSYDRYVRAEIFEPLDMSDSWIGMPGDRFREYGDRVGVAHYLEDGEWKKDEAWGTVTGVALLRPGGNGYGPMRELAILYEMLLGGGARHGTRILSQETVSHILHRHSEGLPDRTFGSIYDRGLGVVFDSKRHGDGFGWFGPHASDSAFGHQGFFSSTAFADPAHDLVVALAWNGVRSYDPEHDRRVTATVGALYEDLGLSG